MYVITLHLQFGLFVSKTGQLTGEQFRDALQSMKLGLNKGELDQVQLRAQEVSSGPRIDYRRFVANVFDVNGHTPHFLQHPRARDSGDIVAWTSPPVRYEVFY